MVRAALCIDVEPDAREVAAPATGGWSGFEKLVLDLPALRDVLGQTGTAAVNWFLRVDPQVEVAHGESVWALQQYRGDIESLLADGDEVGLHPHSWRWDERFRRWVSDQADAAWVDHVLDIALEGFAAEFGAPCRIHRYGDRFMSAAIADRLSDAGVLVDLTLEPGMPARPGLVPFEASTGLVPYVPLDRTLPYRAARGSYTQPAPVEQPAVTMVPLTTGLVPGLAHPETLTLWTAPGEFARRLRLRRLDPDLRHLAFAVRSETALYGDAWSNVVTNLAHLADVVPGLIWVPASSLAGLATADGGAWSSGPLGGAAAELDRVADLAHAGPGEPPASATARQAAELDRVRGDLDVARRDSDDKDRRLEEAGAHAAELTHRLALAQREQVDRSRALDVLAADLARVQATATWRVHQRLLPLLRPLARVLRRSR